MHGRRLTQLRPGSSLEGSGTLPYSWLGTQDAFDGCSMLDVRTVTSSRGRCAFTSPAQPSHVDQQDRRPAVRRRRMVSMHCVNGRALSTRSELLVLKRSEVSDRLANSSAPGLGETHAVDYRSPTYKTSPYRRTDRMHQCTHYPLRYHTHTHTL